MVGKVWIMACLSFVKHIAQVPCNRYNTAFVNQKKLFFPSLLLAYSYDTGGKLSKKTTTCHKRYPFSWRSHSYMTQPIISSAKYIIKSAFFNLFFKFLWAKYRISFHFSFFKTNFSDFDQPTFSPCYPCPAAISLTNSCFRRVAS